MSFLPLPRISLDQLERDKAEIRKKIRETNGFPGICLENFLRLEECQEILRGVYILAPYWRNGTYEGEYTLGRSWYASLENKEALDYFEEAPVLNQLIQNTFPTLIDKILDFAKTLVSDPDVQIRSGWAGPGIVVFQAGSPTAKDGGSCHIDCQGLSKSMLDLPEGTEVYSFMLPLGLPEQAGGLNVWPEIYQRFHHNRYLYEIEDPEGESFTIPYKVGDLFGIHSLRIHQIEPFGGEADRVIVTFHLAKLNGKWNIWF